MSGLRSSARDRPTVMYVDLNQIRSPRERLERTYAAAAFEGRGGSDFAVREPVRLEMELFKDEDRFRVRGRVTSRLELGCSRCLEPFSWPVDAEFDLRYLPQVANLGEGEIEVETDDLSTAFYRDNQLDVGQLLEEQFYLALPMKPLCRPDCAGLCPECGANLNAGSCGCAHTWTDPRLAGLRDLLDRGSRH